MADSSGRRTLLLGLDAACSSVLDSVFEAGAAPALEALFERGASGPLESQHPPWTPSAWPSLYTGVNPGKHGVYGFLAFDGYDWDVVDRTRVRQRALWEILDRHGYSSVVVNVPVTHPPRSFDGALVPGYIAPEDPECHPAGLLQDVRESVGEYTVYEKEADSRDEYVRELQRLVGSRGRAFRYLADRFDPDFGFLQFQATDTVFHALPGDAGAVAAVYRAVDDELAATLDAFDPDVVFVVSDHGIGEYTGYEFRVNEFLRDHGYVGSTRRDDGVPSWSFVRDVRLRGGAEDHTLDRPLLVRAMAAAAAVGLTSQRIGRLLDTVGLAEFVEERVPASVIRSGTEQVDFTASRAFMRSRIECGVRINLTGREPDGAVEADEYVAVRDELLSLLRDVTTPDGDPVFEEVATREEFFDGPYVDEAADVQLVPADYDQHLSSTLLGEQFAAPSQPYNHKPEGVVAVVGPSIDSDDGLAGAHLLDVAPSVLATFGVPASECMDGATLPVVASAGRVTRPAFENRARDRTGDGAAERRVSELGYFE